MSSRRTIWTVGLLVNLGLVAGLVWDEAWRRLVVPVGLIGLAASAMVAEVASLRSPPGRSKPPPGARLADGVVDLLPIAGSEGEANPVSPRFRRFERLREIPGEPGRVDRLPADGPALLGRVALISVFVGRDGSGWSDDEIARGLGAVERAGLWIERQAKLRAVPVNLGLADVYFRVQDDEVDAVEVAFGAEGDDVGPMEAHASTKAVILASRAAAALGFADVVDLVGKVGPRVIADARVWLFHVRRSGRSLAIPALESEIPGVGLALCYSREASFPEPLKQPARVDPVTVAHELLHLFGASDKYGVARESFSPGSVSHRDIMRLNQDRLDRMAIDPLTASEIGWVGGDLPGWRSRNARRRPETVGGGREIGRCRD
jgi:hypothetical protein